MKPKLVTIVTLVAIASCAAPPETHPVVIAPGPAPATMIAANPLIAECRSRFAQSLAGQPVTYNRPEMSVVGSVTTVRLTAASSASPTVYDYVCTFDGPVLVTAGRG
jgi:hypothetical protein